MVDVEVFSQSSLTDQGAQHPKNDLWMMSYDAWQGCRTLPRRLSGRTHLGDSPAFDEWQFFQRDGLRRNLRMYYNASLPDTRSGVNGTKPLSTPDVG